MQLVINLLLWVGLWYAWPKIGVVDTNLLVAKEAQIIAKAYPKGVPAGKLATIASKIEDTTVNYAKKYRLLLIAKQAVCGSDLPDHTDNILKLLKEHDGKT